MGFSLSAKTAAPRPVAVYVAIFVRISVEDLGVIANYPIDLPGFLGSPRIRDADELALSGSRLLSFVDPPTPP